MAAPLDVVYATGASSGEARALDDCSPGLAVRTVASVEAAADRLEEGPHCLVAGDDLPDGTDLDVLRAARERDPAVPVVLRPRTADPEHAAKAARRGVAAYLPLDVADRSTLRERVLAAAAGRAAPDPPPGVRGPLLVVDEDGTVVHAGDGVASALGHDPAELEGSPLTAVMPERFRESHRSAVDRHIASEAPLEGWRTEAFPVLDADGEEVPASICIAEFAADDRRFFAGVLSVPDGASPAGGDRSGPRNAAAGDLPDPPPDGRVSPPAEGDRPPSPDEPEGRDRSPPPDADDGGRPDAGDGAASGTGAGGPAPDWTLGDLLDTTRRLVLADSRETVSVALAAAVEDLLGYELALVRLYDPEEDALVPVATSDRAADVLGDRPDYEPDQGLPGAVFESGEPALYQDLDRGGPPEVPDSVLSAMFLPLGDHGTVSIGSTSRGTYDESDVHLAELLTRAAVTALDRVARDAELRTYRTALETVRNHVFVVDEGGRFSMVTEPMADMLGDDREALVGASAAEWFDEATVERGQEVLSSLRAAPDRRRDSFEATLSTPDGDVPVEIELATLPDDSDDLLVGVVRDRSRLAETRAELRDARDRFTYLFENIPDAVVEAEYVDGEPVARSINSAFEEIFGYDAETVIGRSVNDFVVPEDRREEGERIDERAQQGEQTVAEITRLTDDGRREFLFRGIPYRWEGETLRGFGIYTDITDQKQRQHRLEVLHRVLRHNLRNEMNLVLGYADRLAAALDAGDVEPTAETLAAGDPGALMAALRERAATVAELSEKARTLERSLERAAAVGTVDAAALVRSVVADCRETYPGADVSADLPDAARVRGDDSLRTVVENLVENAVEHSDRATPRVTVTVEPRETESGERVAVSVADDGPGIPDHEQVAVSDDPEITPLDHASGLGLWVAAWVTRSLGGEITYDENDPRGSVVTVLLRRAGDPEL